MYGACLLFPGWSEQLPDTPVDESVPISENIEKIKKRYRKKKNKLEEIFPVYLQVQTLLCIVCYLRVTFAYIEETVNRYKV